MYHLVDNLTNKSGDALVGYYVKLKDSEGAYATLYSDASSTPIATVSGVADAGLTDASGMYDIYVADGDYDIEVFDKNDITLLVSRIPAIPMYGLQSSTDLADAVTAAETAQAAAEASVDAVQADLASTDDGKGSEMAGFKQSGTGAVDQTIADKGRQRLHIMDFIPKALWADIEAGSNTDDLSGYLQAALDTGRVVHMPDEGLLHIGSGLLVPSGSGLVGDGFGSTIKALADFGNFSLIRNSTLDPATSAGRDQDLVFRGFWIDGNKANNSTASEFSHGLRLQAVNGASLDIKTRECKGDGVLLMYAYPDTGDAEHLDIGCANIYGFIRSEDCSRQGVALACIEDFDLSVAAYRAGLLGLDVEPDNSLNFVRNGVLRLRAFECGQLGTGLAGALLVQGTNATGTGVCDVSNLDITVLARDCASGAFGGGVNWRDIKDVSIRGKVINQTGVGLQGISSNIGPSLVNWDIDVINSTGRGLSSASAGDVHNGSIRVRGAGDIGAYLKDAAGGTLQVQIDDSAQQGIYLDNTDDMTFHAVVNGSAQSGVYLANTSSGNRFPNLKSINSTSGYGYQELSGCSNNRASNARLSGNGAANTSVEGTGSLVTFEPLIGEAVYDAPSIAAGASATTTVTVTSAGAGDHVEVTFDGSLGGLMASAYVSADNTVTVVLFNPTAAPIDLGSATITATVTQRRAA